MKKFLLFFSFSFVMLCVKAQTDAQKLSVMFHAEVQVSPAQIKLQWNPDASATSYALFRKTPSSTSWGPAIATPGASDSVYTDNSVTTGVLYEYRIIRYTSSTSGYGYLMSGIQSEISYNRGYIILAVDSFFIGSLDNEIETLIEDYQHDGWFVERINTGRSSTAPVVKAQIVSAYNLHPFTSKALMLLGHVPVPYSGLINPDGHTDHLGAWPSDVYYADIDGTWTDTDVNDVSASSPRNQNVPGDGKFDQDMLSGNTELQTGRVDFYNLPVFSETETQLMQQYLNKLHAFKTRQFIPAERALVEDNFVGMSEGFAASGYMNFSPLVAPDEIYNGDYSTDMQTGSYLCSYGTGPGSYTSAGGIINASDFAADSIQSVFTFLFGSYFGDWDSQNNLLRAALGSGTVLANAWAGRPHWHIHPMGMGENIGYSARLTQNNTSLYFGSTLGLFGRWVHIALMGDPALRLHYIAPPASVSSMVNSSGYPIISWTASPEPVLGYHVYRREVSEDAWERVTPATPITVTNLGDYSIPTVGTYVYMVRAVREQTTASGKYYNQSLGVTDTVAATVGIDEVAGRRFSIFPNPAGNNINIICPDNTVDQLLSIHNQLGQPVYSTRITSAPGQSFSISLSGLGSGVYFVRLGGITERLIKQ